MTIDRLTQPAADADIRGLAALLVDAVESGSAVSFLPPLSLADAESWWRRAVNDAHPRAAFLVARDDEGIAGTVQVHPAWAPNQPHRGDVAKLIVHRRCRGRGLAARLMAAAEAAAREEGLRLLTLDTKRADPAERLYRTLGWTEAGVIPGYALNPDGSLHDTVIFFKWLDSGADAAPAPRSG